MVLSKKEGNVKRLLAKCELMAKNYTLEDWKLSQFILNLEEMIEDLMASPEKPCDDVLSSYWDRLKNLKGMSCNNFEGTASLTVKDSNSMIINSCSCDEVKQKHMETKEQTHMEIRQKLFCESDDLRIRKTKNKSSNLEDNDQTDLDADLDDILKYHHYSQEKISDSMLALAQNIKEISLLAGNIIRKDTQNVEKSSELADRNYKQLHIQSEKLQEQTHKSWRFWVWLLLIIVLVIFINMVLFMKVMKKAS